MRLLYLLRNAAIFGMLHASATSAMEFAPYPCGEKTGAPISASHVTVFTDDVVAYRTFFEEFIVLDCRTAKAVIVPDPAPGTSKYETWQFEPRNEERSRVARSAVCGSSEMTSSEISEEMTGLGYKSKVRRGGISGRYPFKCICKIQAKGGHSAMAGILSFNSESILPSDEKGCS